MYLLYCIVVACMSLCVSVPVYASVSVDVNVGVGVTVLCLSSPCFFNISDLRVPSITLGRGWPWQ
jgi:hypothetical protein